MAYRILVFVSSYKFIFDNLKVTQYLFWCVHSLMIELTYNETLRIFRISVV